MRSLNNFSAWETGVRRSFGARRNNRGIL
jgi:hypothetical protein